MSTAAKPASNATAPWTIVGDNDCPIVDRVEQLVRQWDRKGTFRVIDRDTACGDSLALFRRLDETPWSLLLVDKDGNSWCGPEAIPFILKNLPSWRIAAVTYTIPGTMWLTKQLYSSVSKKHRHPLRQLAPTADIEPAQLPEAVSKKAS